MEEIREVLLAFVCVAMMMGVSAATVGWIVGNRIFSGRIE